MHFQSVGNFVTLTNASDMLGFNRRYSRWLPLYLVIIFFVLIPYGLRLWLLEVRQFDPDEFEHLHVAWLVSKGQLPYVDFFEHHTPWFHFFLAPFFSLFHVETNARDAVAFLFLARRLMWILTGIILLLVFLLGKMWRNPLVGLLAALFLINTEIFSAATLEIRPDLFACIFWLACLIMVVDAVRLEERAFQQRCRFTCGGILLGAGLMSTQKVLFAGPGLAVALAIYVLIPLRQGLWLRFRNVCFVAAGVCVSLVFTLGYFYWRGGAEEFIYYNFLFNIRYKDSFSPLPDLHQLIFSSPYLAGFGLLGLLYSVGIFAREKVSASVDRILVPSVLGVLAGLFIVPVPHAQYYLLLLPLLAVFAAAGIVQVIETVYATRQTANIRRWIVGASYGLLVILVLLSVTSFGAGSPHPFFVVAFWFCAAVCAAFFLWQQQPLAALAVFSVMISLPPVKRSLDAFSWRNTDQIDQVAYVIDHTVPTDRFMDGFTGTGLFRPNAYFFWFLHVGIQNMLTGEEFRALLTALRTGKVKPDYIIFDKDLRRLPTAITSFFSEHYQPVGQGDIWKRKEITVMDRDHGGEATS